MSDTKDVVEIDDKLEDSIATKASEKVSENVDKQIDEKLASFKVPTAEEIAEKMTELREKSDKKDVHDTGDSDNEPAILTRDGFEKLTKEQRFAEGVRAFLRGDRQVVRMHNRASLKAWQSLDGAARANYQNETVAVDGGALVPAPEFIAEIDRLTNNYGVASRLATIRRTDRNSVTLLAGTNEVSFTRTSEATAVNAQKLTYAAATQALDKYIATMVMTSELVEDSAIDIFQDAANEIARARAKLFDQLVFTDATYGLLYAPDAGEAWKTLSVGAAISNFDADDAINAQYQVLTSARQNARYFMHPSVFNLLRTQKASTAGTYLFGAPGEGVTPTVDGYPVELVDIMPSAGEISANQPFAVFGDLSRVLIHVKRLLETKVFDAGTVKDGGGSDINLITQDAWAMRATLRCVPQTRFPAAFCILGTGVVS